MNSEEERLMLRRKYRVPVGQDANCKYNKFQDRERGWKCKLRRDSCNSQDYLACPTYRSQQEKEGRDRIKSRDIEFF